MRDDDARTTQPLPTAITVCDVCQVATSNVSCGRCLNCLDVEIRLPVYLQSPIARAKVRKLLDDLEKL